MGYAVPSVKAIVLGLVLAALLILADRDPAPEHVVKADATTVILISIAVASLILSRVLMKQAGAAGSQAGFDDSVSTFASRNAPLPYVIGRRKVGATVVSVWGRFTKDEKVASVEGGKGGGGGGGGDINQTIYYEEAVHFVCLGPVNRLRKITQNGEVLWEGSAGPNVNGEFSFDLGKEGAFTFFFGNSDDVRFNHRQTKTGTPIVNTKNKWIAGCRWNKKRLGPSADWPQIEYEVEALCPENALSGSAYLIAPSDGDADLDKGVNAAHVVYQLLTAKFPHGAGIDPDFIDGPSLRALGYTCQLEGLGVNLMIMGDQLTDVMADLLNMMGVYVVDYAGTLVFVPIRRQDTDVAEIPDAAMKRPVAEVSSNLADEQPSRVMLSFPDVRQNYKTNGAISLDDDGIAGSFNSYNTVRLTTKVITSSYVMTRVGNRKMQEAYGDRQIIKFTALRGSHLILPGRTIELADIGTVRVTSMKHDIGTFETEIEAIRDSFSIAVDESADDNIVGGDERGVQADRYVQWYELLPEDSGDEIQFVVARIRAHTGIVGANILADVDTEGYVVAGQQPTPSSGGPMRTAINLADGPIIENGPIIDPYNEDINDVVNLDGDQQAWQSGRQLAAINDEVFFLRSIDLVAESQATRSTAYSVGDYVLPSGSYPATGLRYRCITAGTTAATEPPYWPETVGEDPITDGTVEWEAVPFAYQLKGLIRNKFGTTKRTHPAGSIVAIIEKDNLVPLTDARLVPNVELCIKSQPFTSGATLDPSLVTPVCGSIDGSAAGILFVDHTEAFYQTTEGQFIKIGN